MKSKIFSLCQLKKHLEIKRRAGKRIIFTNGCFDILHVGHVRYLIEARFQGDLLVVGLNSDNSVRKIKGEKRPVVSEAERAEVLSGLWAVDFITIFDDPNPLKVIVALKPDVLVKGADWPEDKIIGAEVVRSEGGKVVRIPLANGASTSGIIDRIINRFCKEKV